MNSKIKVLHIATSDRGGAGIAASRLNDSLREVGVDSYLIGSRKITSHQALLPFASTSRWKDIFSKVVTVFQKIMIQKYGDLVTPYSTSKVEVSDLIKFEPNIIHIHSFYNLLSSRDIVNLINTKIPIFITLHDERFLTGGCHCTKSCVKFESSCSSCPQARALFSKKIESNKQKINDTISSSSNITFVCPSEWISSQLRKAFPESNLCIEVIRNPISKAYFNLDLSHMDKTRNKDYEVLFISENLFNSYKGFDLIMECIKKYGSELSEAKIKFRFVGNGNISSLRSVNFTQFQYASETEMIRHYFDSDLLIIPSSTDNSPNIIFESTMCGTPFICSDRAGLPELASYFGMRQFESLEPKGLFDAIMFQKNRDVDRQRLRNLALQLASPIEVATRIKELYQAKVD